MTKNNIYQTTTVCIKINHVILRHYYFRKLVVVKGLGIVKLKSLIPLFYQEAKVLVNISPEKCDVKSKDCDISQPIAMATMEMIWKSVLGVTLYAQRDGRHKFVEALRTVFYVCYLCNN